MNTYKIAVIPGDGIGKEVVPEGLRVIEAAAAATGECRFQFTHFPWGCGHYLQHGTLLPDDGIATLSAFDAIYLGGVGMPDAVPEEVAVRGLILKIRVSFDQFANVRPIKPFPGRRFILADKDPADIDLVVIRENTEGMYIGLGGRYKPGEDAFEAHRDMRPAFGQSNEIALQTGVFSEAGCRRIIEYAFSLAEKRGGPGRVTSCTKANALNYGMTLWNDVFDDVAARHRGISADWQNVDAMAMRLMAEPEKYDVIVAPNLFGDIITDLTAVLQGGLGVAPGGNISTSGPSMFEPPHGTAPDIAGKGIANPIAAILTAAMMLEHLGEDATARRIRQAVEHTVSSTQALTPDMGGQASTIVAANAIVAAL